MPPNQQQQQMASNQFICYNVSKAKQTGCIFKINLMPHFSAFAFYFRFFFTHTTYTKKHNLHYTGKTSGCLLRTTQKPNDTYSTMLILFKRWEKPDDFFVALAMNRCRNERTRAKSREKEDLPHPSHRLCLLVFPPHSLIPLCLPLFCRFEIRRECEWMKNKNKKYTKIHLIFPWVVCAFVVDFPNNNVV